MTFNVNCRGFGCDRARARAKVGWEAPGPRDMAPGPVHACSRTLQCERPWGRWAQWAQASLHYWAVA